MATPQYFEPGGGVDDESAKSRKDEVAEAEPGFEESLDKVAENIQRALRFDSLDFNLGLANGWEYSSQNSFGGETGFNNSNTSLHPRSAFFMNARSVFGMSPPATGPATDTITTRTTLLLEPATRGIRCR